MALSEYNFKILKLSDVPVPNQLMQDRLICPRLDHTFKDSDAGVSLYIRHFRRTHKEIELVPASKLLEVIQS